MMRYNAEHRSPKKVVNKESGKKNKSGGKNGDKPASSVTNNGLYYSFLTVVLLLCLIQVTISAVLNISKIVSYNAKIKQISNTRNAAQALNDQLVDSINNFSNVAGLEAIARNNLKMSSEDEVMVIINTKKEDEKSTKKKWFWEKS